MLDNKTDWYKDAVLYELYVRAYRDANGDGHGDLQGVIEKLDYLRDLGVDCIWLLPISPSPLHDDGYDVSNFYGIHPDYGQLEDFKHLIDEAHKRGLRVITDLVMNHTSSDHSWFSESRSSKESLRRDWYVWTDDPEKYGGTRIIFTDTEISNWTFDEISGEYYWHRFFSNQPDLNYDNPEVREEMKNVIRHWLDIGIDGFRLDAIPYLFEREGTSSENLEETHAYLKEIRAYVDAHWPGTLLLGEANQWPQDTCPYFGNGSDEMNLLFHFPVMPRLYKALAEGKRDSVAWIMEHTPRAPDGCQWVVFLRNHDELTLEMVTEEERAYMYQAYAPEPRMKINVGIRRRLAPLLDNDMRKIKLMNSMLMTLPGTPILYYGDEIGMGDNIWLPDRHGVRTPMQWNDQQNAGFSEADTVYSNPVEGAIYGYQRVNVNNQEQDPCSLLNWTRDLIRVRKQHPSLGRGEFSILQPENRSILPFLSCQAKDAVLAVHNLSEERQSAALDLGSFLGKQLRDCFTGEDYGQASEGTELDLPPYGYLWLQIG